MVRSEQRGMKSVHLLLRGDAAARHPQRSHELRAPQHAPVTNGGDQSHCCSNRHCRSNTSAGPEFGARTEKGNVGKCEGVGSAWFTSGIGGGLDGLQRGPSRRIPQPHRPVAAPAGEQCHPAATRTRSHRRDATCVTLSRLPYAPPCTTPSAHITFNPWVLDPLLQTRDICSITSHAFLPC